MSVKVKHEKLVVEVKHTWATRGTIASSTQLRSNARNCLRFPLDELLTEKLMEAEVKQLKSTA